MNLVLISPAFSQCI